MVKGVDAGTQPTVQAEDLAGNVINSFFLFVTDAQVKVCHDFFSLVLLLGNKAAAGERERT
jgi:hypothetical protein